MPSTLPQQSQLESLEHRVKRLEKRLEVLEEMLKHPSTDLPPSTVKEPDGYL